PSCTRPSPPSTLFPYTTLFRSIHVEEVAHLLARGADARQPPARLVHDLLADDDRQACQPIAARAYHRPRDEQARREENRQHVAKDRKSTRLNSSHRTISYAVFC